MYTPIPSSSGVSVWRIKLKKVCLPLLFWKNESFQKTIFEFPALRSAGNSKIARSGCAQLLMTMKEVVCYQAGILIFYLFTRTKMSNAKCTDSTKYAKGTRITFFIKKKQLQYTLAKYFPMLCTSYVSGAMVATENAHRRVKPTRGKPRRVN